MSFAKRRPDSRPSNTRYASSSGRGGSRFSSNTRVGGKGNNGGFSSQSSQMYFGQSALPTDATSTMESFDALKLEAEIDRKMGFDLYDMGPPKVGWLINMHSTSVQEGEDTEGAAAVNYYFLGEDGENFKAVLRFDPYFLIGCKGGRETDVEEYVRRKYEGLVKTTQRVVKEDLSMPNHIAGYKRTFVKIVFANVKNLLNVRRELLPLAEKNRKMLDAMDVYADTMTGGMELDNEFTELSTQTKPSKEVDVTDFITEVREYDVPYHVRTAIDEDIRIGKWYTVEAVHGEIKITEMPERLTRPDPIVLAFDIETTKLPLKFPDVQIDKIMMISYMIDGMGFLITNREIVSEDIDDFEYTPKPEYEGIFTIFNEKDEKALLERFFSHIQDARPTVIVTYNGDFFDWPFVEGRAKVHGIDMYREIGFQKDSEDEYKSSYCCHMDAFRWVKRDSYLPQGSQGLKAVTTAKMGYDPKELDPELMTRYASEHPQILSEYSVSDAVATYYLYMKYVHPFIFSLCNIIPLNPDEVLRKGTGTLCEMLLMVQAYQGNIVLPNKHKEADERFYEGHLLESETYVGGHVESLEAGVFRSDIPTNFDVDPKTIDRLLDELDDALKFTIEVESKKKLEDVTNYDEIREQIASKLQELKETHKRKECPLIYHLDVSSMYPNIMITNRLQPDSMVTEADCATCDFNRPGKNCDRRLPWSWRGEFFPAKKDEYNMIRRTLQGEKFPGRYPNQPPRAFADLPMSEQNALVKKRLSDYSRKVYHKIKETKTIEKEAIICQRENPFYADTVRDFRDRRYEYKNQQKLWKRNLEKVDRGDAFAREEAKKMVILYDSLQLAHKVILNSFYGYVMRKGSRWYSMEMAGVTCLTGATIIQMARALVEKIGRPLELDTDGIWCILPKSFPENFLFKLKDGGKVFMSYPCAMLNHLVHDKFTNNQYQTLVDPEKFKYEVKSENSIFFEVDGPYRAMILPTSKEEDKNLKKRYAVFNDDGSLAELKGFEVKRRGELRLIKIFQSQIFKVFLDGSSLEECYASVAKVSDRWLDVLDSKGVTLADDELIDLICENRSMSRALEDYGSQKSTSISTAKRLAEFLGEQMVKDKGLNCKYIISEKPKSAPVTERAIPVAIFSAEESIKSHFLRRWLKDPSLTEFDPRDLIDWGYYRERLASVIQKIITIPAALQKVPNPVPRVEHPDWLHKRIQRLQSGKQTSLDVFKTKPLEDVTNKAPLQPICDLEDLTLVTATSAAAVSAATKARGSVAKVVSKRKQNQVNAKNEDDTEALFASLPLVQPDINTDYVGWLGYMKKKWKIQRQARERRKHLFGDSTVSHRANAGEVTSFLKNQAEKRYGKEWQILQITESETPGVLKCWVMITGRIQSVTIKVDRKVYVDFKDDDFPDLKVTDMTVEKVNRTLPNGSSSPRLFRLTMKDEFYAAECQKVTSIFTHQSVAGVYEGHIDNATRFVLDFGNSCQINMEKKGVLGKGLEFGFEVSSLVKCPANQEYLNSVALRVVFLYHVVSGDRQIFAIFSSFDEQADIFVYESSSRQQQPFPNLETVYKTQFDEMASRLQTQSAAFKPPETLKFNVDQHSSLKRTKRAVSARLLKLYSDSSNQAVLALMSPHARAIERDFAVVREMPVLRFAPSQADLSLPPLGWQLPLARRIVLHFLGLGGRIAKMTEMARYANIPLGNLKPDDTRLVIDVQYARKLQEAGVILWWSPTPFPDLGGREKDQSLLITENLEMPVINNASSYEDVCIDISVQNLVINTVLTSALINEMEGTDNSSTGAAGDGASLSFMENASSAPAIAVLRDLVKQWWEEALAQDKHADEMVNNFVLWVSSAESHLFDPVLQYHVRNLSRKAFLQLLAEFRRVGSQVVHAQQDKLVIKTSKAVVGNAYSYAQYVVKSICAKPLFNFLELKITQYWDYLLWMDDVNYGGFACTEIANESALQTYSLVMNWHIKSFLPEMLQNEFSVWVEDFLELMHTAKTNEFNPSVSSGTPRATQLRGIGRGDDEFFAKGTMLSLQKQLKKRMTHLLRRQIDATASEDEVASAIYKFPTLPGSHLKLTNPTLELVKSLCAVFSLVRELNLEVRVVRRDLLALFEVKEFSDAGVFKNPSTSLKLSQICTSCSLESELDFCRDEKLMPLDLDSSSGTEQQQQRNISWRCKHCARDFNRLAIEERMISDVMSVVTSYQTQDLRCSKCKQIKEDNLSEYCVCSGEWELSMSPEEIRKRLNVYRKVAEFYGLRMLDSLMRTIVT
ncbi:hypothetical protein BZA70DRAFT_86937 [Myxozyma melibiosi]|uniref:DNA polymerase epsilon catalytic subunit n=1 Tax=Myxozyma melibiosi TaxID=54550 RepID=A0ABR1EZA7_9ASCO